MYNFSILLDQTSAVVQTETVSPSVVQTETVSPSVDHSSSDSVSDGTAIKHSSCCSLHVHTHTNNNLHTSTYTYVTACCISYTPVRDTILIISQV